MKDNFILFLIIFAQFCCTSLWFAGNAVMDDLVSNFQLSGGALGSLTSAVQVGFIVGTLIFSLLNIADQYDPSRVFFCSAFLGALFNWGITLDVNTFSSLFALRFLTGFFLAGIYPVGMKIAADYFEKGLGKSLGLLVGALVLGTAFPHVLKGFSTSFPWRFVLYITTGLAISGGLLMFLFVPNGPYRKQSQKLHISASFQVFKKRSFRAAAIGYFGHMWEVYAFWAFVPVILQTYQELHPAVDAHIPFWSFLIIASGAISCSLAGYASLRFGAESIANFLLAASGLCCMLSPLFLLLGNQIIFFTCLLFWGMAVAADSPLFSTLVAQQAPPEYKGTALTIVTCIGFFISIFSIQLLDYLTQVIDPVYMYLPLAAGPVAGLALSMNRKRIV